MSKFFEVKESSIPRVGVGLYSRIFLPKGTKWWKGNESNTLLMSKEQYTALGQSHMTFKSQIMMQGLQTYCYYEKKIDSIVWCLDDARYVNHSIQPNSGFDQFKTPLLSVALRDIEPGEEIFENYENYDYCTWAPEVSEIRFEVKDSKQ